MGIRTEPDIFGQDLAAHNPLGSDVTDAVLPPRVGFQGHFKILTKYARHGQFVRSSCDSAGTDAPALPTSRSCLDEGDMPLRSGLRFRELRGQEQRASGALSCRRSEPKPGTPRGVRGSV